MFYKITSSKQTKKFAGLLASIIASRSSEIASPSARNDKKRRVIARRRSRRSNPKNALVLALSGDLGSGKTTFVQGFLKALGIRGKITSPTFVIVKSYKVKSYKDYKKIFHIDCYRIKKSRELLDLGLKEILNNPENIVLIEWPERIKKILPKPSLALPKDLVWIKFEYGEKENERVLKFQ